MADHVEILGFGMTKIHGAAKEQKLDDMVFEAASKALNDAGIERRDLDSIVIAGSDEFDGRCISSMLLAMPAGAYLKDEIKVADEGCHGVVLAALRIMTGHFNLSLVAGWCKTSEAPISDIMRMRWDPFFHRPFGMNHVTSAALMAGAYQNRCRPSAEAAARIVVKNRANGKMNEYAHLRKAVTLRDVHSSPIVSWPLRALDVAPESDGACALVLASSRKSKMLKKDSVRLAGFGWSTDSYYLGERNLAESISLRIAAERAYKMAGIRKPLKEIDLAEVSDFTSYHELIACEALGFCDPGQGPDMVREGLTGRDGMVPVNPSGGILCGNPFTASGLFRVSEAYRQLAGKAEGHQIRGAHTALAQSSSGFCAQGNAVFVLRS